MTDFHDITRRSRRIRLTVIAGTWVALSLLLFAFAHFYLVVSLPEATASDSYAPFYNLLGFTAGSILLSLTFGYAMVYHLPRRTKRRSFSYGIVFNTLVMLGVYVAIVVLVTTVLSLIAIRSAGEGEVIPSVIGVLTNPASIIAMLMWALMIGGTQFVLQVSDKFGQGVLWDFVRGRYFKPRQVERIFMFLDLSSSTTIAERLGHVRYFEFLAEFIADVTEPIIEHGGVIYQYVGDEVVVSWPLLDRRANARCLSCFFASRAHIHELGSRYQAKFGIAPDFKAGLHAGAVTAGEVGIVRKEIVFSGDVLNTTARIRAECNTHGVSLLLSGSLLEHIDLGDRFEATTLGTVQLRGREQSVDLITVRPAGQSARTRAISQKPDVPKGSM